MVHQVRDERVKPFSLKRVSRLEKWPRKKERRKESSCIYAIDRGTPSEKQQPAKLTSILRDH